MARRLSSTPALLRTGLRTLAPACALAWLGSAGCDAAPSAPGGAAPALARVTGEGAGLRGSGEGAGPRAAGKVTPESGTVPRSSPGSVPCAEGVSCPVSKSGRTVCCHAPNSRPLCRDGAKCGRSSGYHYTANLACDETADCAGAEPGKDVVCCLSDDGEKPRGGTEAPYNRGACVPRAACAAPSTLACSSDAECGGGKRCRPMTLAAGLSVGACL